MKNVLHIISSKDWRGGEQQVNYMFNYESQAYRKFLFCVKDSEIEKRNSSRKENLFSYKKRSGFDIAAGWSLKKICTQNNIDLLHLHDSHAINTYFIAGLLGLQIQAVIQRHVNFPLHSKWKYNLSGIKKILCVSEEVKTTMLSAVPENKLILIHPCIDVKKYAGISVSGTPYLHRELNLDDATKIVGIIASLEKEKNIAEFMEIAHRILTKRSDIVFVISGEGRERSKLELLIGDKKDAIFMLGFRNDIVEILSDLDVFLLTSKNEGFPLVLLEAMAARVPVLSTGSGGIKNMIRDKENGLLYPSGNSHEAVQKIDDLLSDSQLYSSLVENAYQYVQDFDVTLMNQKLEAIYSDIQL